MRAWLGPRPPLRGDLSDLREREPELPSLRHETQHPEHVGGVDAVARGGSMRARQDAAPLVETQRLTAEPAARGHFPDQQIGHEARINLAPCVKVKRHSPPSVFEIRHKRRDMARVQ